MTDLSRQKTPPWFAQPMRIAALQCNYEQDSSLRVLDKWRGMGFNVEQLFHPMAEDYTALFDEQKHGRLLRSYLAKARRSGVKVILYLNVHIIPASQVKHREEWAQRNRQGEYPRMYETYYACCVNSAWREHFFGVLESLRGLDIGGVFLDGPYFTEGGCRCPACRERQLRLHGRAMTEDADLAEFCRESLDSFLRESYARFKAVHPEGVFYQNLGLMHLTPSHLRLPDVLDYNDIIGTEGGFMFYGPAKGAYLFRPGLAARVSEAVAPEKPRVIFMAADQKPWSWVPHTPAETALCIASSAANGSSVWYGLHGSTRLLENPSGRAAGKMFRFMEKHEDAFAKAPSLARVALLFSLDTERSYRATHDDSDLYGKGKDEKRKGQGDFMVALQGTADLLARSGVPFDVVTDLALSAEKLARYDCLILPTSACLGEAALAAIEAFVARGGNLIAFHDSSFFDEKGRRRKTPGLAKVFGIEAAPDTLELKKHNYFRVEGKHPLFKGLEETMLFPAPAIGVKVKAASKAKVLARYLKPLAGRYVPLTAPEHPAIIWNRHGKGQCLYFAGTFGEMAADFNPPEYRRMLLNALAGFAAAPAELQGEFSNLELVVRQQEKAGRTRLIIHLVNHAGILPRPFEKIIPQSGLSLLLPKAKGFTKARALAAGERCPLRQSRAGLVVALPKIEAYEVLVVE